MVASADQTEDKNGSNLSAMSRGLSQVSQGEYGGAPRLGSTLHFPYKREDHIESYGDNPEVLNNANLAFLLNTSGKEPKELVSLGGADLKGSVRVKG